MICFLRTEGGALASSNQYPRTGAVEGKRDARYLCALALQAAKSGVQPLVSLTLTSAPRCKSSRIAPIFLLEAAICKGILSSSAKNVGWDVRIIAEYEN